MTRFAIGVAIFLCAITILMTELSRGIK